MSEENVSVKVVSECKKSGGDDSADNKQFFGECKTVYKSSKIVISNLKIMLIQIQKDDQLNENFGRSIEWITPIIDGMRKISTFKHANSTKEIESHRMILWKSRLFVEKLAICKLTIDMVVRLLDSAATDFALRLAHLFNEIMLVNLSGDFRSINVFSNTCPTLLHPLRKLSMARILQILATKRAETCSFHLIHGLLNNYFESEEESPLEGGLTVENEVFLKDHEMERCRESKAEDEKNHKNNKLIVAQNSVSSNTSLEIYRALTKHLDSKARKNGNQTVEDLWRDEEKRVRGLLALSARVAPQLLATNLIVSSKTGHPRLKSSVKNKLVDHYQQVLWGEVGGYLEHILLWWNPEPLGSFPPSLCQNFRHFVVELKTTDVIPPLVVPSVNSLLDAMCCHLTSTSWDQLFRKTLVSAGNVRRHVYKEYGIEGSAAGQLFVEMLSDLIKLSNSCEDLNLQLEELPLVEQIPILHRLDHSVHMVRLWCSSRCRHLATKWDLDEFYCTCHTDITTCLQTLNTLQLTNHGEVPASTSVQVTVCTKMRAKLVSEIRENIDKLRKTASECIDVLAKNCRTECLAVLHMSFPDPIYWRQNGPLPDRASEYVEKYLDLVLRPVFMATHKMSLEIQQSSSAMILRILCESWLEYVYLHRVKFSEWGAVQLLTDFGAVPTWLLERVHLPKELLNSLVSHEVLRRCEGVGRLLLRRRGESIRMTPPPLYKTGDECSADNMPAEMYVPNQEQWLDLRAPTSTNICCQL